MADTHETENRAEPVAPDGVVMPVVATAHVEPFQVIATGGVPLLSTLPTAMQKLVPTHDTERRPDSTSDA